MYSTVGRSLKASPGSQVKSSQIEIYQVKLNLSTRPSSHPAFMDLSLSFERLKTSLSTSAIVPGRYIHTVLIIV